MSFVLAKLSKCAGETQQMGRVGALLLRFSSGGIGVRRDLREAHRGRPPRHSSLFLKPGDGYTTLYLFFPPELFH